MITEQDLQAAIAECQGQRNPNASTCIKLAAYLTIQEHLYGEQELPRYSYASEPLKEEIDYFSDSEFGKIVNGRHTDEIMPVIDELMETVKILNPRLYAGVLRKLQ